MDIRLLGPGDAGVLLTAEPGLFDNPVDPAQLHGFLADPLHEMAVAREADRVVSFASGTVLLHPDKPPQMFVAEVGTRPDCRRRGYASGCVRALIERARARGCAGVWLATEADNAPARALYAALRARETPGIVVFDWDHPDL